VAFRLKGATEFPDGASSKDAMARSRIKQWSLFAIKPKTSPAIEFSLERLQTLCSADDGAEDWAEIGGHLTILETEGMSRQQIAKAIPKQFDKGKINLAMQAHDLRQLTRACRRHIPRVCRGFRQDVLKLVTALVNGK
jgi:hypothetical protein